MFVFTLFVIILFWACFGVVFWARCLLPIDIILSIYQIFINLHVTFKHISTAANKGIVVRVVLRKQDQIKLVGCLPSCSYYMFSLENTQSMLTQISSIISHLSFKVLNLLNSQNTGRLQVLYLPKSKVNDLLLDWIRV